MTNIQPIRPNITFLVPVTNSIDWGQVVSDWIKTKRSHHTQRAYSKDLNYFLAHEQGLTVGNFLRDSHLAYEISSRYRGILIEHQLGLTANEPALFANEPAIIRFNQN